MALIHLDSTRTAGKIKPMHGGGQPPVVSDSSDRFFHYLTEAGIPYSRLHDVGGAFGCGKYVDIPNIFRDFDADETDPASYDFTFTDRLLAQLHKAGVEPYYRLGVTIENAAAVKSYWIDPPKDPAKWARICEHIIRHYTEGWADGYHYDITYWEIWGEPDNDQLWTGTAEQYYELYCVTASHLKQCFPNRKIGGYGSCGFYAVVEEAKGHTPGVNQRYYVSFFEDFLKYIRSHGAPLDFYSWHSYAGTADTILMDNWLHERMTAEGFGETELHLNEWDPFAHELGTAHHSAELAAMMIAMQNGHEDVCCIYDMRINMAPYCPLFHPVSRKPIHGYYSMVCFDTLFRLGTQMSLQCDTENLYALAATDGVHGALLISNLTGKTQSLTVEGADLTKARWHVLDQERLLSWSPAVKELENNAVVLVEW